MRTPAPRELLDAWDLGATLPLVERVSPLLRLATGLSGDALAGLGIGERDRLLIALRERLFGATLRAVVDCPACGVPLEVVVATPVLLATEPASEVVDVDTDGFRLRCGVPRARDVADAAAAAVAGDAGLARTLLVGRAVLSAERDGAEVLVADLPDHVVAAAADALADADPLVDVELPLSCEACGVRWNHPFDIGSHLWQELDAWSTRMVSEVHSLATAYGWSEGDILGLTPIRRRRYLDLVGHG